MNARTGIFFLYFLLAMCLRYFCGATICKPLSKFVVDCNICRCSGNGREYSCTQERCPPADTEYLVETTRDGYVLLTPKKQNVYVDDFVLTRKLRQLSTVKG